jgi:hypothetical protein
MYIRSKSPATSGGGGGVPGQPITDIQVEWIDVPALSTNIVVGINGGILPLTDSYIFLQGATGDIEQGAGAMEYTINRGVTPNELDLITAPLAGIRVQLTGFY